MAIFKKYYSKQSLWILFLISALPIHLWTFISAFRDFQWISERTNSWDAIGTTSYGLLFSLIESIVFFSFVVLLGFFISTKWEEKKRVSIMSSVVIIVSLWAILNQTYFVQGIKIPERFIEIFVNFPRPLLALYGLAFFFTLFSLLIPIFFILYSAKFEFLIRTLVDRLSLLMALYLFIDIFALIIILIRNL